MKTKKTVICALFTALTCVATMVIQIKLTANGYVNLGDCMVVISGIFLGFPYGLFAGGIGSMLADIISSYYIYAPATLIIKALMAVAVSLSFKKLSKLNEWAAITICSLIAETIMVLGYFLYETALYGWATALTGMPGNLLQAGFGFICSVVLYKVLSKNKYISSQIRF